MPTEWAANNTLGENPAAFGRKKTGGRISDLPSDTTEYIEITGSITAVIYANDDNGYTVSAGTDRAAYMTAQTQLLMGTHGLFMANGDWYDNEMRTTAEGLGDRAGVIKMMKTPIISAIRSKTPSITSNEMLSDVVEAIDSGATSYDGVDDADFQTVLEARTTIYSIGPGHTAVIPKHAAA